MKWASNPDTRTHSEEFIVGEGSETGKGDLTDGQTWFVSDCICIFNSSFSGNQTVAMHQHIRYAAAGRERNRVRWGGSRRVNQRQVINPSPSPQPSRRGRNEDENNDNVETT